MHCRPNSLGPGAVGRWTMSSSSTSANRGCAFRLKKFCLKGLIAIQFVLPESKKPVRAQGTVIWNGESNKAGIKFGDIPVRDRQNLCEWLSVRTPPDSELAPKPGVRRHIDGLPRL